MKEKKVLNIANFNLTFGKENKPMLEYLEEIVLPAFKSKIEREDDGNRYLFDDVQIVELRGYYFIVGEFIKRTTLEIRSRYSEKDGIRDTNERVPSDPYSLFIISLNNHRMILIKNQKGSPDIRSFNTTAKIIIGQYVKNMNKEITIHKDKLPKPNLNVVAIPFSETIQQELRKVKKVKYIKLKFYPLNGDIPVNSIFNALREEMIEVGSKSASTTINTPKDHKKLSKLISETQGTVQPVLRVIDKNGSEKTLNDKSFTENITVEIDNEKDIIENMDTALGKVINNKDFNETSEENKRLYDKFLHVIKKLKGQQV
ncbi:hypothetical protein ACE3NQ_13485 [Paenibacillus terreus]|uniref:Uncharacterized protein n=1 Tax=Paenibacillus terreus TaxID=1387834 RepID=A0ABV5B8B5_9BACL